MTRFDGKVALVTGAARGQGRSHAVRLAREGADLILVDICAQIDSVPYPLSTPQDLAETADMVRATGSRVVSKQADTRDYDVLADAIDTGVAELGRLDIVIANAGITTFGRLHEMPLQTWQDMIDVNLTGTWHTCRAALAHVITSGNGGSIVIVSSVKGLEGAPLIGHYVAAKHGLTGLMRSLALEVGEHRIRVNTIHPGEVDTAMLINDDVFGMVVPGIASPTRHDLADRLVPKHALPIPWEPRLARHTAGEATEVDH